MVRRKIFILLCSLIIMVLFFGCATIPVLVKEKPLVGADEIPPGVRLLYEEADRAFETGQMEDALGLYRKMLRLIPAGTVAVWSHIRIGEIFATKGDYEKTIMELRGIVQRFDGDPLYNEVQYQRARSYARLGKYDLSDKIAEKLLREKISSHREAQILSIMGDNLLEKGEAFDALSKYMAALKRTPDDILAHHIKANVEDIIIGRLSRDQLELLRETYAYEYPSGYVLYALAQSYYEMKDMPKARETLRKFLRQYEGHPYFEAGSKLSGRLTEMDMVDRYAIGCLLPLTGRFANYGNMALDAIVLASGVFDSRENSPIKLIIEDTKSDPETARDAVVRLYTDYKVIGIIGPMGSTVAYEAAREAQKLGIPMLTLTQRDGITEIGDYIFRNFLTAGMQIQTLVEYAVQNLGMKSFAILYPEDNYGIEMMNLFWDEVLRWGGEIRGVESYEVKKTDFGEEIKALTGLNFQEKKRNEEELRPVIDFDAIFIPDSYKRVSMIAPQLAFYDVTGIQLLGTNAWNFQELLKSDSEYLEGAIFVDGFFQDSYYPAVRDFIDRFFVAYGREPMDMEALAYDAAGIMVSTVQDTDIEVRDDLRDKILHIKNYPGITGETSFLENGDVYKSLYVLMIRDNEIIQIK